MGENVKHFSLEEKNDNTYGWPWNEVVKTFLQSHYNDEEKQCSIKIRNKEYKILKRESVTVFYDADGNTLFDVTNDRLEKEYESGVSDAEEELENNVPVEPMGEIIEETKQEAFEAVISEGEKNTKTEDFVPMGTASLADIVGGLPTPTDETIKKAEDENAKPLKQRAKEKLEGELKNAKDKNFVDPVITYLLKRCEEDDGLAEDVLQNHKTWEKCYGYIYEQARKQKSGNCAVVRDDVVYEWAEDYFHLDDKAIEEKKKKEEKERRKSQKQETEKRKQQNSKQKPAKEKTSEKTPDAKSVKEVKKKTPKKNEPEGQMSLFDLL